MSSLRGMLEFVAVVECGTFTGAAKQLDVSVSHISRQIADLESRLTTQLFVRTTRQMQLTESGKRLFDHCDPLMQELMRAQETLLAEHDALEGLLRVSLAGKLAEEQLIPLLSRFCHDNPQIQLEVDVSSRNVDLIAEGYHLAIRMGPLESTNSLISKRLISVPMVLLASPLLLTQLGSLHSPADLPEHLCLPLAHQPWNFIRDKKQIQVSPQGRFKTNSGGAAVQAAIDGIGIINVLAYYATEPVESGKLVRLLPEWQSAEKTHFYIVYPAGRHMLVRVRRLIDFLQSSVENRLSFTV
ncbi:LysR family transcriptional regulator [Rouxiella sp. WC2420]|uniref:LysR family transcriptional regulator n=1 Tax=Rouxiella sp. WC2420 TaxID=3234145 RepID=A0AB39VX00_9GAMM